MKGSKDDKAAQHEGPAPKVQPGIPQRMITCLASFDAVQNTFFNTGITPGDRFAARDHRFGTRSFSSTLVNLSYHSFVCFTSDFLSRFRKQCCVLALVPLSSTLATCEAHRLVDYVP